jgi:hypothetical protein
MATNQLPIPNRLLLQPANGVDGLSSWDHLDLDLDFFKTRIEIHTEGSPGPEETKGADSEVNRTSEKRTRGYGLELEQWENESGEGVMRGRENEP